MKHPIIKGLEALRRQTLTKQYCHYDKVIAHALTQAIRMHEGELDEAAGVQCEGHKQCKNTKCEHAKMHQKTKKCRVVWVPCNDAEIRSGGCYSVRKR